MGFFEGVSGIFSDINECASNPCQNGGNCTDGVNGHECDCPEFYTGDNCEIGRAWVFVVLWVCVDVLGGLWF